MTILELITKLQNIAEARSNDLKVLVDGEFEPKVTLSRLVHDLEDESQDEEYVEL